MLAMLDSTTEHSTLHSESSPAEVTSQNEVSEDRELLLARLRAINSSYAAIEFKPDGTILDANDLFLSATGYRLDEIQGKHHRMFMPPGDADRKEYAEFWLELASGKAQTRTFKRVRKDGQTIWISASYMPIYDSSGNVVRVRKHALDVTQETLENAIVEAKLDAINRSQAMIELEPNGTIIAANDIMLKVTGYKLDEIVGCRHRMLVTQEEQDSPEYQDFCRDLAKGKVRSGRFKRVIKGGKEIWIFGQYNPVIDDDGNTIRVIKLFSDISDEMALRHRSSQVGEVVAEGTAQISVTISDISENVHKTANIVSEVVEDGKSTDEAVSKLEASSRVIEKVVEVINGLANQTKLLALNATIESVRAGEAGQSFAVVANQVKELAGQTENATKNIEHSLQEIKSYINGVVSSTGAITNRIKNVNSMMNTIAAAVEEQAVTIASLNSTAAELKQSRVNG